MKCPPFLLSLPKQLNLVPRSSRLTVHQPVAGCIFDIISSLNTKFFQIWSSVTGCGELCVCGHSDTQSYYSHLIVIKLLCKITFCLFTPSYRWQWMLYLNFFKTHFCCCSCVKIRCSIWACRETPSGICWEVQASFSTNTHGKRCHFWWTSIKCCCRQIKVSEAL